MGFSTGKTGTSQTAESTLAAPGAGTIWGEVKTSLEQALPAEDYKKWIEPLRFAAEIHGAMIVTAKDRLTLDRATADYGRDIQQTWARFDPRARRVKLELWSRIPADIRSVIADPWAEPTQDIQASEPAPAKIVEQGTMTFDTLVVGPSNENAARLAEHMAGGGAIPNGVITFYGPPGCGKTHILKATIARMNARNPECRVTYISAEEFMTRFVDGARVGDTKELQTFVRNNDFLMIDDLHWIKGKQKTERAFFGALRSVTSAGGRVIITGDAAPGEAVGFSNEIANELRGSTAVEVALPTLEMRRHIVEMHAGLIARTSAGFVLSETQMDRIASAVPQGGRELTGVLNTLLIESAMGTRAIDEIMLERVIRRIAGEPRKPTLDDIKRSCMEAFNVTKTDIEGRSKRRTVVVPRQIGMFLSRELTDKSFPQIVMAYKKKDHTTAMHACDKIEALLAEGDRDMAADVEKVRAILHERLSRPEGNS